MRKQPEFIVLITFGCIFASGFVHAQGIPRTFSTRPFRGGPPQVARAVLENTAELPCDINAPDGNDTATLVVWYRHDITPIFSYDMRKKNMEKVSQWMHESLMNRAYFRTGTEPATLNINHVEEDDEGEYRCRVDFMQNPTRNSRIQLSIIVPPHKPSIIDDYGKTVEKKAGPYQEGGDMRLSCIVTGGRPEPTIRWWKGQKLLDSRQSPGDFVGVKRSTLVVKNLTRTDLNAIFTCQASNNNISQPVSASINIDLYLRPLVVQILPREDIPLSSDRRYNINCTTYGSRPPARITWYLDGKPFDNYTQEITPDGNQTSSTLTFRPSIHHNGKLITCRAVNSNVKVGFEEDSLKLNIFYVPRLNLKLGSNMNPDDIEEGDDVYFECQVDANPAAYKVVWKHNGNILQNNLKLGIIAQQGSLALRKVTRSQAGNYTCIASNVEGDGFSNTVELKVMYKPICVSDQKRIYGIARHEDAKIVCRVESYPAPDSFRWAFNNTEEMQDVPQSRYKDSTPRAQSVLTYTPVNELDYGTVLCWASNTAGQQKNACIFHIIPAGKPEPPYNCTIANQTTESLSVECTPGFDGGQNQHFLLEVFDQQSGDLQANISSNDIAGFTVRGLEPGRILNMFLYAYNVKGRSEPTLLEGFTLKVAEKQTGTPVPFEITPLLGILIGVVTALLFATVTILAALKVRNERRAQRPGDLPLKKSTAPSSEDLYDADDRNPDVIPINKDSDYQLTGSTAGTPLAAQNTPDGHSTKSASSQKTNHLPNYSHNNDYNNYPTLPLTGEVTYAELCLARPTTLSTDGNKPSGTPTGLSSLAGFSTINKTFITKESTVYACIDHNARPPGSPVPSTNGTSTTGLLEKHTNSEKSAIITQPHHHPREIVTVRTPLISSQESCV